MMKQTNAEKTESRPMSVTFNIPLEAKQSTVNPTHRPKTGNTSNKRATSSYSKRIKTADLSHMSDRPSQMQVQTFIPSQYVKEISTPIPLKAGLSQLNTEEKSWHTNIFPSDDPTSRVEIKNLTEWLNQMLKENIDNSKNQYEIAKEATKWFTIAYDELCRQVALECDERAKLLLSIWNRYQSLFHRVTQLHQEETNYLIKCHKERVEELKTKLNESQTELKTITQQYRDDLERWSNSREREEAKFTNLRKKLDLQVKNKRSLLIKIKSLKEQAAKMNRSTTRIMALKGQDKNSESQTINEEEIKENEEEIKENQNQKDLDQPETESQFESIEQLLDKIQNLRHRARSEFPSIPESAVILDDLERYISKEERDSIPTREWYPSVFRTLHLGTTPHIRSVKWMTGILSDIYGTRLTQLVKTRNPLSYSEKRTHLIDSINQQFFITFGVPSLVVSTMFDLIESARYYASIGFERCKLFLRFIDLEQPYLDSIYLDFYCYCLGCFQVSNGDSQQLFPDVYEQSIGLKLSKLQSSSSKSAVSSSTSIKLLRNLMEKEKEIIDPNDITNICFYELPSNLAVDLAKKVLFGIAEGDEAEQFLDVMKKKFNVDSVPIVSGDALLEFLLDVFHQEEKHVIDMLHEQYEMDAGQYNGIVTLGQFQTLAMFSSRKLDNREYTNMMSNAMRKSGDPFVSFDQLVEELHQHDLLVPFNFDRLDYSIEAHSIDRFVFMEEEYKFHLGEFELIQEKAKKSTDAIFTKILDANSKFYSVIDDKRISLYSENAQRDYYELLVSVRDSSS